MGGVQVIADLRALWPLEGFRRLFAVRLVSQSADGMFQVGLATLFFFSPENASTATGVAAAFAVLLLPFTVVGPWAGVLLDRWRRRQVLLWGNVVRVGLTVTIALLMVTDGVSVAVYVLALVNLSINRFLLSALSASLPRVVDGPLLLTANSLTPTLGAAAAGVGAGLGFLLGFVLPAGRLKDAAALTVAAAVMGVAAALATRLGRDQLGPVERADATALRSALGTLARGLVAGARHLVARRTPAYALGIMATHRFLYGVTFIASILIARNLLSDPADATQGLATFGTVAAASAVGFALAVVVTPVVSPRTGPHRWIVACLALAAASQVLLAVTPHRVVLLVCAATLGLAAQGAKIAVDTIVQRDTDDAYRGRAFALYDVLYNAAFVGAAALGAVTLPDTGWSRGVFLALAAAYVAGAVGYGTAAARTVRHRPAGTTVAA
ncbi:MFS transporter [Cellulomonas fimi]|uniref:Major facilitator superfamily MFS_1 n=1 Tax=Cellulomonas fimi (strain ATCC 484 / DSM 20113 / JCM 1341 / CCUG 24087 / LMG 16345 / NBRC 15513 / NCIMB 8980 / NCTC 7547 / NRS-133) TaxID=590998 RepID=F4H5H3_CELFA|nr:MFS transporter [Cellulomonas fimi]AEE47896.1 major facilitator superfamily MFS_1 [Cellulomonas fimi ATCC 484]NNH09048.1 MFS transporter [Cellulomonas fimi]VEH37094.1 2-acyl-glycerophospho-ethanolamine acyltransferase [Cellulomonas fimi]